MPDFVIAHGSPNLVSSAADDIAGALMKSESNESPLSEIATLGGGCFWCVEAVYQRLEGVESVISGYAGGQTEAPDYHAICTGTTGHAEVVQITFDPSKITFEKILDVFWVAHDPTTLNRQGHDVGTQYRSVIFYHNDEQKKIAEESRSQAASLYSDPIVTEIAPLEKFYPGEDYHQNYFNTHSTQPYCSIVIRPKVEKLLSKKLISED